MKKHIFSLILLISATTSNAATLNQYDSAIVSFDNLLLTGPYDYIDISRTALIFSGFGLSNGDQLYVEFFEDSISETPITSWDLIGPDSGAVGLAIKTLNPGYWWDLQGMIRFTMIEGSVDISHVNIDVIKNSMLYEGTYNPTLVPLPAAGFLFISGFLGMTIFLIKQGREKLKTKVLSGL